ncbi:hypothetical protein THAOC_31300 [Thalassiosira oceanica]|uniref:Uncharacterized protein n=1 Tax=Thalassiosira oceanica TaxID=159749 RepID=K0R9K7_THAOC|nr:hypothetical protein THAOC_31300 [Thalassiosira oceanica]|eukprot:EJK49790.1 hypothetical protein THAOC_31300 [Thalassiosira oceanica]
MDNGMEELLGRGRRMHRKTTRAQESETQVTRRKAPKKAPKNAAATGRHAKKKLTASSDNDNDEDPDDLLTLNEYGAKTRTDKQGSTDAHPDKDLGDERLSSPQKAVLATVPRQKDQDHLKIKFIKENEARLMKVDNKTSLVLGRRCPSLSEPCSFSLSTFPPIGAFMKPSHSRPPDDRCGPICLPPQISPPLFMLLSKRFIDMGGQTSEGSDTAQLLGGQSPSRKANLN